AAGAPFGDDVISIGASDAMSSLPGNLAEGGLAASRPAKEPMPEEAPAAALAALREKLVHVEAVSRDSHYLWVDFAAAARSIGDAEAQALLDPVREQVVDLSLARSRITDASL